MVVMTPDLLNHLNHPSTSTEAAAFPDPTDPDDVVDESITRDAEDFDEGENSTADGKGVYAVVELGASNKPRYMLGKIQNYLYEASNDVRRSTDGGYVYTSKAGRRASSVDVMRSKEVESSKRCSSTSSSLSSGGLRRKLNGAIKVVQRYKDAVQSGIRFRELRDGASVVSDSS